jgi:hypothetical protein
MDDVLHPPEGGPMLSLYVSGTNTIFLFVAVCVAYGMVSALVCRASGILPHESVMQWP